ncbi:Transcription factor of the Forkhead/HNF3 family [Trachipleistophora hominis]|uniref:Transcription factor of the Forkhead/HNF3 family n=1 Tax=Trachipleistophora hominis TaxID=72359 RepID=L7JY34_TRAHO|nr:Transcription factor of the Forkhead/HNF3 family [Trachipleistophora hominis]
MTKHDDRNNVTEHDALEGMMLLKTCRKAKKPCLAILRGNGKCAWQFEIYHHKFQVKDGCHAATFYYCVLEKSWFIFPVTGLLQVDEEPIRAAIVLRSGSIIKIGTIMCCFDVKFTVRKEYKKLLVEIILSSAEKRLSLSEIYQKLLSDYNFSTEKNASWKNSIRCVLSESKIFYKIPKKIKRGRGGYWCINGKELAKMDEESIKKCEKRFFDSFIYDRINVVYTAIDLIRGQQDKHKENIEAYKKSQCEERIYNHVQLDECETFSPYSHHGKIARAPYNQKHKINYDIEVKKQKTDPWFTEIQNTSTKNPLFPSAVFDPFEYDDEFDALDRNGRHSTCIADELSSDFSCLSVKEKRRKKE